jgi:ferredoxin
MKAKVDAELCGGYGLCEDICPEVFELKNGISTVKVDQIPSELEEKCKQAEHECPTHAISVGT